MGGFGLWSLVWGPLLAGGVTLVLAHALSGYVPRLGLTRGAVRRLAGFGGTLTAKNVFVHLSRQADNWVVGRVLGADALGLYSRAFNYSTIPEMRLVPVLYGVLFPAFSRVRDDTERFVEWFGKSTALAALVSTPVLLGLLALADDFTAALLGQQWLGMVAVLRALCIAGLINALHKLGGAAIEASGKLRYDVVPQIVYAALVLVGSLAGARYGIEGVGVAIVVAAAAHWLMKGVALRLAVGVPWRLYGGAAVPALVAGGVMCGVVRLVATYVGPLSGLVGVEASWARLIAGTLVGVIVYPSLLAILAPAQLHMVTDQLARLRGGARRSEVVAADPRVAEAGKA